jgi:hypothetical protein
MLKEGKPCLFLENPCVVEFRKIWSEMREEGIEPVSNSYQEIKVHSLVRTALEEEDFEFFSCQEIQAHKFGGMASDLI